MISIIEQFIPYLYTVKYPHLTCIFYIYIGYIGYIIIVSSIIYIFKSY